MGKSHFSMTITDEERERYSNAQHELRYGSLAEFMREAADEKADRVFKEKASR